MAAVLIIEDETQVLILAESVLQHAGYETVTAIEPWILLIVFPPNCGQPKKERANLRHRQTIFGTAPLMRKNGWSAFAVKSRRHSLKQRSSNNAPCGRVSETGAFSAFGFDYRRKRSVLIIVVIIGVWTVSVPDCSSGGA